MEQPPHPSLPLKEFYRPSPNPFQSLILSTRKAFLGPHVHYSFRPWPHLTMTLARHTDTLTRPDSVTTLRRSSTSTGGTNLILPLSTQSLMCARRCSPSARVPRHRCRPRLPQREHPPAAARSIYVEAVRVACVAAVALQHQPPQH